MPPTKTTLDVSALAACAACIVITVADGRWTDAQTFWMTVAGLSGVSWAALLYRSWPRPAPPFETGEPRVWRAGWAAFLSLVAFGVAASIIVYVRDGVMDPALAAGSAGALLASLRAAVPMVVAAIPLPGGQLHQNG